METTFHDEERRPRTVIRAPSTEEHRPADYDQAMAEIITALDPFPEARMAVVAALKRSENGCG